MSSIWGAIPNLHIKLHGDATLGSMYLPYGKNMVRGLMFAGRYAATTTERLSGNVVIQARIVGDQRFLEIFAGADESLFMDSGIVDTQNVGITNPALMTADGRLHYSTEIRQYTAEKKLLGNISPPSIGCDPTVEMSVTKAFAARVDSEGNRDAGSEALLASKKMCASRVPPSIFTGKLRLYAQAHYGAALKFWKFTLNLANHPPALQYEAGETTFTINSNQTGIYTDGNKRHWMIKLESAESAAKIYRMKASAAAEKLRPLLLSPDRSDDEKEKIEAYILSTSYPDPTFVITKPVSIPINYSFGYGWHFNWDGTAADIIKVETIHTGGVTYKHRSTHYRITFSRNEAYVDEAAASDLDNEIRRWVVDLETVETKEWKNFKWQHVIASPIWDEGQLEIFGQLWGDRFGDGAPIYCFYTRNELNVVRYSTSGGSESGRKWSAESDPPYFMGEQAETTAGYPGSFPGSTRRTCGFEAAEAILKYQNYTPRVSSFSVGSTNVGGSEEFYGFSREAYGTKSRTYAGDSYFGDVILPANTYLSGDYGRPINLDDMIAAHPNGLVSPPDADYATQTIVSDHYYVHESAVINMSMSSETSSGSHAELILMLVVIPFFDAEAVYLWGEKQIEHNESATVRQHLGHSPHLKVVKYTNTGPDDGLQKEVLADATPPQIGADVIQNRDADTLEFLGSHCISNAGVKEGPVDVATAFFAGEPNTAVSQTFATLTSVGGTITGEDIALTDGYDDNLDGQPIVFTGWA